MSDGTQCAARTAPPGQPIPARPSRPSSSPVRRPGPSSVDADVVADGSPAAVVWHLLCGQYGVDWVIPGKLLARKRPRLLPVDLAQ